VHAGNAVVTDVGTEFVVRAYSSDSGIRVAVRSGVVSLADAERPKNAIVLRANDVGGLAANASQGPTLVSSGHASAYTAWVDGRLVFDNEPLDRVALELSRWFDVTVRIESPTLGRRRVSGTYASPTPDRVLGALAASLGAAYTKSNGEVVFRERPR
jgi:ferric-dicitrate binding protein FerR (iron transport regulator)